MIKKKHSLEKHGFSYQRDGRVYFMLLILSFSAGCLAGSLFGSFFGLDSVLNDCADVSEINSAGTLTLFFSYSRFHLVALFLGTSVFGLVMLPVLSCVKGYALSCTAATIISCYPEKGLVMAAVILGIPAIFSLPCFFVISIEGFLSSTRIFHFLRGNSSPKKDKLYSKFLICLPLLAAGTFAEIELIPYLVSLLT